MEFDKICVQTGHDGLKGGEDIQVSGLLDEYWKEPQKRMAASDFDQTMTRDDVGVLVFQETLNKPNFWEFPNEVFRDLLLPTMVVPGNILSYRELVAKVGMQNISTTPEIQENAQKLSRLFSSLGNSYEILHVHPENDSVRERFAREMIEFDAIVLKLEPFFSDFFGNQIFSRTRFLAGKSTYDTKQISCDILEAGKIQINNSVLSIFEELKKRGAETNIVTTNLLSVVREIVSTSVLNTVFYEDDVIATKLIKNNMSSLNSKKIPVELGQYIEGEPVFGKRKVELLKQKSVQKDRRFSFAAGDSVSNDGPMMAESIKKGGISLIVVPEGADVEHVAKMFESEISNILKKKDLSGDERQRMWYLQSSQFVDARKF